MRHLKTLVSVLALVSATVSAGAAEVEPVDSSRLERAAGTVPVKVHLLSLQQIARVSDNTRASGTIGFRRSADYVKFVLRMAGLTPKEQVFDYDKFIELSEPVMAQTQPAQTGYTAGEDFTTMEYSAAGDVTARLALAKGIQIPPKGDGGTTNSGCSADDFGPSVKGKIVLIQRGTCTFGEKVAFAAGAGAAAAVIFNEGQEGRTDVLNGTLGGRAAIPAIGISYALGKELFETRQENGFVSLRITVDAKTDTVKTLNVIADRAGKRDDRVVVVGAHLDSVEEGPGINDNGSGTAQLLATAIGMKLLGIRTENTVRFAFWGAEESGLIGSTHYVDTLSESDLGKIMLNLNFDMLGSPNYARLIYDGDGTLGEAGPAGSDVIEHVFEAWFKAKKLRTEPTEFDGRSDYFAFIENGIPAGGLFSGAEEVKTARQVKLYGGTAGVAFDKCYHQACDTISNVNFQAIRELGGAAVNAILTFAQTKTDIRAIAGARADLAASASAAAKAEWRGGHLIR